MSTPIQTKSTPGHIVTLAGADAENGVRKYVAAAWATGIGGNTTTERREDAAVYTVREAELTRAALVQTSGGYAWKSVPVDAVLDA